MWAGIALISLIICALTAALWADTAQSKQRRIWLEREIEKSMRAKHERVKNYYGDN